MVILPKIQIEDVSLREETVEPVDEDRIDDHTRNEGEKWSESRCQFGHGEIDNHRIDMRDRDIYALWDLKALSKSLGHFAERRER